MPQIYKIPSEFDFPIHHIRPRFKHSYQDVLLYLAAQMVEIGARDKRSFNESLNQGIREYPGNISITAKAVSNWRTEIPTLFAMIQMDIEDSIRRPSRITQVLDQNQDLIQFFRLFLLTFQYPGGYLSPAFIKKYRDKQIKFRPASFLLQVLTLGDEQLLMSFAITKAEASECIFNDLRITSGILGPEHALKIILDNRDHNVGYQGLTSDRTRYAGDILDYMVEADLIVKDESGGFRLNRKAQSDYERIRDTKLWFPGYDDLNMDTDINPDRWDELRAQWFDYVNAQVSPDILAANPGSLQPNLVDIPVEIDTSFAVDNNVVEQAFEYRLAVSGNYPEGAAAIGKFGEDLVLSYEKDRLQNLQLESLNLRLINKIQDSAGVGYDIQSFNDDGTKRYIEVKTTTSVTSLKDWHDIKLSKNEWNAAISIGDNYYVYRLLVSRESVKLLVIHNPLAQHISGRIRVIPEKGVFLRIAVDPSSVSIIRI